MLYTELFSHSGTIYVYAMRFTVTPCWISDSPPPYDPIKIKTSRKKKNKKMKKKKQKTKNWDVFGCVFFQFFFYL